MRALTIYLPHPLTSAFAGGPGLMPTQRKTVRTLPRGTGPPREPTPVQILHSKESDLQPSCFLSKKRAPQGARGALNSNHQLG